MDDRASPAEGNSTATEPRRKLVKRFFGGLFDLQSRQSRAISQQQSYATSANTQPTLSTLPGISTVPVPTMSTSSSVATTAALQPPTILPLSTPSQSQPRLTRDSHRRDILATLEREFPLCDPRFIHCLWRHPHFTSMDPASAAEAIRSKLSEMAGMYPQRTPVQPLPSNGHCDITSDKFRLSSDGQMLFAKDGRILHANTAHLNFSLYQLNEMFPDCDVTHLKDIVKITAEYPLEHTIAHLLAYECNCDGIEAEVAEWTVVYWIKRVLEDGWIHLSYGTE
ncbi:hypothetical protein GQ42DRAFT_152927 [Ramicandelaber brevisporus]|nr:hypothetical protein GQ42DRAFT_152927 [Ramicandelaber brevisporus]